MVTSILVSSPKMQNSNYSSRQKNGELQQILMEIFSSKNYGFFSCLARNFNYSTLFCTWGSNSHSFSSHGEMFFGGNYKKIGSHFPVCTTSAENMTAMRYQIMHHINKYVLSEEHACIPQSTLLYMLSIWRNYGVDKCQPSCNPTDPFHFRTNNNP